MAPIYQKALVIGATSGIGLAFADKLIANGTRVIASGRRQERLDAFQAAHRDDNGFAFTAALDLTKLASIPEFAASVLAEHPDLDCVILNSGIQRAFDFSKPETIDLSAVDEEVTTNYTSYVHLLVAFLPHLQRLASQEGKTAHLVFISATMGLVPGLLRTPNYNATKSALHSLIMALRQQLVDAGYGRLRVVEVFPPAVQTELHDERHQPDLLNGGEIGMPLQQYTDTMFNELAKGAEDYIGIGHVTAWLGEGGFENERQKLFQKQHVALKETLEKSNNQPPPPPPPQNGRGRRNRVMGPQSALTDYLSAHNISAREIAESAARRRAQAESSSEANTGTTEDSANATISTAADEKRKKQTQALREKIKKSEGYKRRVEWSDEDEDEILRQMVNLSAPLPGQMENCAICSKRFTVTPYSLAGPNGGLLCSPCGKELAKENAGAQRKKKKPRTSGGAIGQRRKVASSILDGTYTIGAKNLVTLCVETLAKNIDLADDLGSLPEPVIDKIARILSKRRLVNSKTIHLFMQSSAHELKVYDGGKLSSDDIMLIFQTTPNLRRFKLRNAVQFKDEVMDFLISRNLNLESLDIQGANLISDSKWIEYIKAKGRSLRALKIHHTDMHVTDDLLDHLPVYAPGLKCLKLIGNQRVSGLGLKALAKLKQLEQLSLRLATEVHSDVFVDLLADIGPNLRTFSLENVENVDNTVLDAVHAHCRKLKKLRITESAEMTDSGFKRLFTDWANPPLEFIDLEKCRELEESRENTNNIGLCDEGFIAMMNHSAKSLRELNIHACRHISSEAFEQVFGPEQEKVYPELKKAEVSFIWSVTDWEVASIFRACPNLKELNVFGCMKVKGQIGVPRGRILVGVPNADGMMIEGDDDNV
ncbi:uncharacterized protein E0L32_010941 [Thyridium curvatum]|uniref:DNA repair protein rhp7 treble clef domain-containing protein n=1 Tax=Thyridium curvatum TaxID=1093900 RepID=A0A507ASE5_9PEZI|nr:uncharacterized protein E0L32_010941 [Thyridium curvatum]TPX07140.1 hypothetical protein E0L32_010941 [Thyridium curvatum]